MTSKMKYAKVLVSFSIPLEVYVPREALDDEHKLKRAVSRTILDRLNDDPEEFAANLTRIAQDTFSCKIVE